MTVQQSVNSAQPVPPPDADRLLTRRRFTVAEYHAMARAGILTEDDKVELLDGQIVEKMTINSPHAGCVNRLNRLFVQRLADRAVVQPQNPVELDDWSEPEPDIALLKSRDDFYAGRHPMASDALLIIEVADSSLARDRVVKVPLYARAGVPEVWIINLEGRRIERFREPSPDGYRDIRLIDEGTLAPIEFPDLELGLDDLLG